jgi:leucyl/phenylalanyl-tRNA--protein transferase
MPAKLHWLKPTDPADFFPDPNLALDNPDGLLAIGGDLSMPRLLAAYRRGIFPWYQDNQPIMWWSPDPRAILFPTELHISRSLRRTLRQDRFSVSIDFDFSGVISGCADSRSDSGTWITPEMASAYETLHSHGHAHSVEAWIDEKLVGGLYGVNIGRVFFGESMFSLADNASKTALVNMVAVCRQMGIQLIDCQVASTHLTSLGSRQIPRETFLELLRRYTHYPTRVDWGHARRKTADLLI